MYAVKIKPVTFGLSYHIGCPVVWAYLRSRGNQKFTPDFLTHSAPDARLLLMTVINYWTNLSKYCDLSMVSISILLEMPKAGANDWSEQQWKSRSRRWVYSCQETGLPFPPFSVFSKNFHWTDPCSIYVASELSGNVLKMVKKTWDGQYYSKTGYLCSKTIQSFSFAYVCRHLSPGDAMISRPIKNLEKNKLNDNGEY